MATNFRIYWSYSANYPAGSMGQYWEYRIYATADLGSSWYSKVYENDILIGIQAMDFISGDTGYYVHYFDYMHSQVFRTSDYLTTSQLCYFTGTFDYRDLVMLGYEDMYVIDNEAWVMHLENDTFQVVYDLPIELGDNTEGPNLAATNNHYLYLACESYLDGSYANDMIVRSKDGGYSWDTSFLSSSVHLEEIKFATDSLGFAVGENGIIIRTQDAGETWSEMLSGTTADLFSLDFKNEQYWLVGGSDGILLLTEDGGETWDPLLSPTSGTVKQIKFPEKNHIVMIKTTGIWRANLNTITAVPSQNNPDGFFRLNPNPARGMTTLSFPSEPLRYAHVTISNSTGEILAELDTNRQETSIDCHSLAAGFYIVTVSYDNQRHIRKLIIH